MAEVAPVSQNGTTTKAPTMVQGLESFQSSILALRAACRDLHESSGALRIDISHFRSQAERHESF